MQARDIAQIARQRAGLTQAQAAARSGHPRETIARWESGAREPSLSSLRALVEACGLEVVISLAESDDSLDALIEDQLTLSPRDRLTRLLPPDQAEGSIAALDWLSHAETPLIVIGGIAAVLQGAPQRPRAGQVEVVASDPRRLITEFTFAGFTPTDSDERWAESDRRWPWTLPGGGTITLTSHLPGARDYGDLRRSARTVRIDRASSVRVAHPRDLLRLADASPRETEQSRVPGLRALLDHAEALDEP